MIYGSLALSIFIIMKRSFFFKLKPTFLFVQVDSTDTAVVVLSREFQPYYLRYLLTYIFRVQFSIYNIWNRLI